MRIMTLALCALLCSAGAARAEVVAAGEAGFIVHQERLVTASRETAWTSLWALPEWWDPEHSYSGDAANLTIAPAPGACWCERLPNGGFVEHMRVISVLPGAMTRFEGGLGPLQGLGASGVMTFQLAQTPDGTLISMDYVVSGYAPGAEIRDMAGPVDFVLGHALDRLAAHANAKAGSAE